MGPGDGAGTYSLAHRAMAAFWAMTLRLRGLSFSARALPPFIPPLRPSATAAGSLAGAVSPVASVTMLAARLFISLGRGFCLILPA